MSAVDDLHDRPDAAAAWADSVPTVEVRAVDLPIIEAARQRRLQLRDREWRCGARRFPARIVARMFEAEALEAVPTDRGLHLLANPPALVGKRGRNAYDQERHREGKARDLVIDLPDHVVRALDREGLARSTDARGIVEAIVRHVVADGLFKAVLDR